MSEVSVISEAGMLTMCNISKQQKKLNIENIKDLTQCVVSLNFFYILEFPMFYHFWMFEEFVKWPEFIAISSWLQKEDGRDKQE